MATEIKMPQLSDTMDSGKIIIWKKNEGDNVARGEILAEVETDKANLEIECFAPGVLLKIVAPVGHSAKVGEVIAMIGQAGEASAAPAAPKQAEAPKAPEVTVPQAVIDPVKPKETAPLAAPVIASSNEPQVLDSNAGSDRVKASPLAKKLASDAQIDIASLQGSGPGGRIVKKDVEAARSTPNASAPSVAVEKPASAPTLAPVASSAPAAQAAGTTKPLSKMRETIARRMQESMNQNPHFYVTSTINMQPLATLREQLKELPEHKGVSVNHFVIKAAAYALKQVPGVNAALRDGGLYQPEGINIGIVTSIPDGLLIPVIKDADKLSLKDLVFEAKAAIERAKAGRPSASDLSGGTFSISNMGMFDVENFTAIINPGQGSILAVGSTKKEPVVVNDTIQVGLRMKVTLSSDHRIIDGIMAATFLKHFKNALESPALMFV